MDYFYKLAEAKPQKLAKKTVSHRPVEDRSSSGVQKKIEGRPTK
jgi:hypothetical protein